MTNDTIIIGGSFAGLAAALYLVRARKRVCIIDGGLPRNRFAHASHGFFGQDGKHPAAMLTEMREQISAYPTVDFLADMAVAATREGGGFRVRLAGGAEVVGKRLLLTFGISDVLPEIPGLAGRWGKSVLHCPYCHGYEAGGRLGVLNLGPSSIHQAMLVSDWGATTFFANGATVDEGLLTGLRRRGVAIEPAPVAALLGTDDALSALQFADGRAVPLDALFIAPRNRLNSPLAADLGCAIAPTLLGEAITVDDAKQTSVDGVFAAGDITRAMHNISFACADGVMAGMAIHRSLVFES